MTLALLLTNCDVKPAGKTHDDRAVGTGRGQGGSGPPSLGGHRGGGNECLSCAIAQPLFYRS